LKKVNSSTEMVITEPWPTSVNHENNLFFYGSILLISGFAAHFSHMALHSWPLHTACSPQFPRCCKTRSTLANNIEIVWGYVCVPSGSETLFNKWTEYVHSTCRWRFWWLW